MSKIHTLAAIATLAIMTLTACGGNSETICVNDSDSVVCNYNPISVQTHRTCYDDPTNPACEYVLAHPNAATWSNEIAKDANARLADQATNDDAADTGYFLQSPVTRLDSQRYDLHTVSFDDVANTNNKQRNINEGVEFFYIGTEVNAPSNRAYVGLGRDTILGGVIQTQGIQRGVWAGQIGFLLAGTSDKYQGDMELLVNFASRSISAFVPLGGAARVDHALRIRGNYDERGVIRGDVAYGQGETTPPTRFTPTPPPIDGELSGIIGGVGAVGAFVNTDAEYVGGFVAQRPDDDDARNIVDYSDWAAVYRWDSLRPRNDFLQGTASGLQGAVGSVTRLDRADGGLSRDATDGVAFHSANVGGENYYYAGVLDSTNLGAPLDNPNASGIWSGNLRIVGPGGVDPRTHPMELEVALGTGEWSGEVDAFVRLGPTLNTIEHLLIDGYFNARGIIRGTTLRGDFSGGVETNPPAANDADVGVLAGLIGQQGAVAVFHGTEQNANYAGGFVANNYATDGMVEYLDWFNGADPVAAPSTPRANEFLRASETNGQMLVGVDARVAQDTITGVSSNLGGETADGVTFYRFDAAGGARHYYAGIFSSTDLGATVERGSPTAEWDGIMQYVTGTRNDTVKRDIKLKVDFGKSRIVWADGKTTDNSFETTRFTIDGRFDDRGLISGVTNIEGTAGTLRGLIGMQGAVGAFISNESGVNGYSGGFVAVSQP